jgi:NTE family protein
MSTTATPAGRGAGSIGSAIDFLRTVPLFSGVSDEVLAEIADRARVRHLQAGDVLFKQGEPACELYVVESGQLEVSMDNFEGEPVRVLLRGGVVGELALLSGEPRSASVRARRDSNLLELSRASFDALLAEPDFARDLLRVLGAELRESRPVGPPTGKPVTIAILPLEPDVPLDRFSESLAACLGRWKRVACLDLIEDASARCEALDRSERSNDHVLLKGSVDADHSWNDFCVRQGDRILCLTTGRGVPDWLARHPELSGCDLVFCRSEPGRFDGSAVLRAISARESHLARDGASFDASVEALARRLAGRSVGLVLSGGGARGLAHIGVLAELAVQGIEVDRVGGCSMGAFIGAMLAAGRDSDSIRRTCEAELLRRNPLGDYTIPVRSLVRGRRGLDMLARVFGSVRFEELERALFTVSCDLISGELVVDRRGRVADAVAASMSLPGVLPPVPRDGRLLVDGGVLNNLPVREMAVAGEGPVIAVDVTAQFGGPSGGQEHPRLKEVLVRAISLGGVDALHAARRDADVLIEPRVGEVGMLDFRQLDRVVEAGRRAARQALAAQSLA